MDIGLLPDIMILEILRHLSYIDLCKASQVSSRWHRISQFFRQIRGRVIDIRENNSPLRLIPKFIEFHCTENLVSLSIAFNQEAPCRQGRPTIYNSTRCLTLLSTSCPNLTYLSLDHSSVRLNLYHCIKYLPNSVTHFSLQFNKFHFIYAEELQEDLMKPNVECLALSNSVLSSMFMGVICWFPNLTEFHLQQMYCDDIDCLQSPLSLNNVAEHLRILNLEGNPAYEMLFVWRADCVALEELYLGQNNSSVSDETLLDSGEMPKLHTLCVVRTSVKKGMDRYVKKFPKLKNLFCGDGSCKHDYTNTSRRK